MESSFPRGGSKPFKNDKVLVKHSYDLFGKFKEKPGKKNEQQNKKEEKQKFTLDVNVEVTSASLLSYTTIEMGMTLLCCVREVQKMTIGLSVPGRLTGRVMITNISTPYTKLLHSIANNVEPTEYKNLAQLFQPGQGVLAKVIRVGNVDDKCQLDLSLMPEDVNAQLNYSSISAGMLLWGAISSCEEHVYVVDLGIKHCRAFLNKSDVDNEKEFHVGAVFWSVVETCDIIHTTSTIKLNARSENISSAKVTKNTSLDVLLPGMKVNFKVTKHLMNGLEGLLFNKYTGYVHEGQFIKPLDKIKFYKLNQVREAHILYVMPITKLTYLTFAGIDRTKNIDIDYGTILNSRIISVTKGGFYVNLKKQKGYVSHRRLKSGLPVDSDVEFKDFIKDRYPKGSQHRCRVLSYDYMDRVYTCSFERDIINEKYFSYKDFKIGEEVSVEIKEIENNGLLVQVGKMTGYVLNEQLTDSVLQSYAIVKSRFKAGQKVNVKVWNLDEQSSKLLFTMKPSFMEETNNLTSYESTERDKYYLGIIVQIANFGLLVSFFGGVRGVLPRRFINYEGTEDVKNMFHIGQMIKCRVHQCIPIKKRITLSLKPRKTPKRLSTEEQDQNVNSKSELSEILSNVHPRDHKEKFSSLSAEEHDENVHSNLELSKTLSNTLPGELDDKFSFLSAEEHDENVHSNLELSKTLSNTLPGELDDKFSSLSAEEQKESVQSNLELLETSNNMFPKENENFISSSNMEEHKEIIIIKQKRKIHPGEIFHVTITNILQASLEVKFNKLSCTGIIPSWSLTKFPQLVDLLLGTCKIGQVLNAICIGNTKAATIFSVRDRELTRGLIPYYDQVKCGSLLHCTVRSHTDKLILNTLILGCKKKDIIVEPENISDYKNVNTNFIVGQYLMAKVLHFTPDGNIIASTRLQDCWNNDLNVSVQYLWEYLNEVKSIWMHFHSLKDPIAMLNIGQVVTGIVKDQNSDGSFAIDLDNGALANAIPKHTSGNIKNGDQVRCVVLWLNFEKRYVEVSLSNSVMNRVNKVQSGEVDLPIGNLCRSQILLIKQEFALVALRGARGKRQLVFVPNKLHPNDFVSNLQYNIFDVVKTEIFKQQDGIIIGVLKQPKNKIQTIPTINLKRKREDIPFEILTDVPINKLRKLSHSPISDIAQYMETIRGERITKNRILSNTHASTEKEKREKSSPPESNDIAENSKEIPLSEINVDLSIQNIKAEVEDIDESSEEFASVLNKPEYLETSVEKIEPKKDDEVVNKCDNNEKEIDNSQLENVHPKKTEASKNKYIDIEASKENEDEEIPAEKKIKLALKDAVPVLSGANNFWSVLEPEKPEVSSEDEVKEENEDSKPKKRKMSPAERAEAARLEEERIRQIEIELADSNAIPKTADQFDRLVLAQPNNSMLWINYMAFHLEATEIEKARVIARKALSTIEYRDEQEKLNVWIAFLNLENRYGTKETFSTLLQEAVQMNDSLTVYLQALNILAESNKITEFNDVLAIATRKFKQEFKMWIGAAEACYKCDQKEQARNLMQRAIKSLNEKQHVNLIVQIAFLESRFNEPERAETLLEKVLASYPRRVDIWTSYIDMLIKGNRIHIARNVLQKAVSQKLPPKKMKTLFTKYIEFETKYGDEESITKVRQKATEYVKNAVN